MYKTDEDTASKFLILLRCEMAPIAANRHNKVVVKECSREERVAALLKH